MLKENYEEVQKKITEACKRAGRNREEVTLIAVSKTKPVEMLSEIYDQSAGADRKRGSAAKGYPLAHDRSSAAE